MSQIQRPEKDEKQEKEDEKQEKSWDEKWRRDPLTGLFWAAVLIWAGIVLLGENFGVLAPFERVQSWSLILLGAGVLLLIEAAIRLLLPAYRRRVTGNVILGLIFIAIGVGDLVNIEIVWPLLLIAFGVFILFRAFLRR